MEYQIIFDAVVSGYRTWTSILPGVIILLGGIYVFYKNSKDSRYQGPPLLIKGFKYFFFTGAILGVLLPFYGTYSEYLLIQQAIKNNDVLIVEGVVTDFHPQARPEPEGFCIKETCFEYSDGVVTNGFNNTVATGSPIREGLPVRITYINDPDSNAEKNIIVKLEIGK